MYPSIHKCDLCGGEHPCIEINVYSPDYQRGGSSTDFKEVCKGCLFKVAQESEVFVDVLGIIKWKS